MIILTLCELVNGTSLQSSFIAHHSEASTAPWGKGFNSGSILENGVLLARPIGFVGEEVWLAMARHDMAIWTLIATDNGVVPVSFLLLVRHGQAHNCRLHSKFLCSTISRCT